MKQSSHKINARFDALTKCGMSVTLRAECQNAFEYRKHGNLGKWEQCHAKVLRRVKVHQPSFLAGVEKIFEL